MVAGDGVGFLAASWVSMSDLPSPEVSDQDQPQDQPRAHGDVDPINSSHTATGQVETSLHQGRRDALTAIRASTGAMKYTMSSGSRTLRANRTASGAWPLTRDQAGNPPHETKALSSGGGPDLVDGLIEWRCGYRPRSASCGARSA